jgi:hypothetical protein
MEWSFLSKRKGRRLSRDRGLFLGFSLWWALAPKLLFFDEPGSLIFGDEL